MAIASRSILPNHVLEKLSPEDRQRFFPGAAGMTAKEAAQVPVAKEEKQLQSQIEQMLRRHGIEPTRQRMDRKSNIAEGMPDISFSVGGRAVYWEVKMPGRKPDPEQVKKIAILTAPPNSAIVRVITSYVQAFQELNVLLSAPPLPSIALPKNEC